MKYLKNNTNRNDVVMTPEYLAKALIEHFKPKGKILEPCKGSGNFLKYLPSNSLWCEISEGKDFMEFDEKVDWIITNPPWSKIRPFIQKSLEVSDNIVFLTTIVHLWMKARLRDIHQAGFGIKEIVILDTPKDFPQSGFQLGAFYLQRGYSGSISFLNMSGISETLNPTDSTLATPKGFNKDYQETSNEVSHITKH